MSASKITFPYDKVHAHNAILWLLNKNGGTIDKLSLIKLIFFSDVEHVLRYGRPIVGGTYFAMKHGPVSSEFYDELKIDQYAPFALNADTDKVHARDKANPDELSESDIEVMTEIFEKLSPLSPYALSELSHEHKAWKQTDPGKTGEKRVKMSYEEFFLDATPDERAMLEGILADQAAWEILA